MHLQEEKQRDRGSQIAAASRDTIHDLDSNASSSPTKKQTTLSPSHSSDDCSTQICNDDTSPNSASSFKGLLKLANGTEAVAEDVAAAADVSASVNDGCKGEPAEAKLRVAAESEGVFPEQGGQVTPMYHIDADASAGASTVCSDSAEEESK